MKRLLVLLAAAGFFPAPASAAPINIPGGFEYTRTFDNLSNTPVNGASTTPWADDSTIPGWWLYRAGNGGVPTGFVGGAYTYQVADGTTATAGGGNFFSLGASGSTERALGNPSTTSQGELSAIAVFQNTSTLTVELTRIRHNVEVVRNNQNANELETVFVWTRTAGTLAGIQTMTTAPATAAVFPASVATTPGSDYVTGWDRRTEAEVSYTGGAAFAPVNVSLPVDVVPASRILIAPGQFFAIRYSNINDIGTDHLMGIDDVQLSFTALGVNLSAAVSNVLRQDGGTPSDPSDDTVDFTLTVTGTGGVNPAGWTVTSPGNLAGQTGLYGVAKTFTGIPIANFTGALHTLDVVVEDTGNPAATTTATVTAPWCTLTPVFSNVLRDDRGTPELFDDTWGFTVTVNAQFAGTGWTSNSSSLPSGSYGAPVTVTGLSVNSPSETIVFTDATDLACTATVTVDIHRVIGTVNFGTARPLFSDAAGVPAAWSVDEFAPTQTMVNGGGAPAKTYRSEVVDLTSTGLVTFSGSLLVNDTSSGNETADTFNARLIIDGNQNAPVSLIGPYDIITPANGVLTGAEITPANPGPPPTTGPGDYTHRFFAVIPESANSVQLVISGNNDSASESFTVQNLRFELAVHSIVTLPAAGVQFDNKGTVDPADDAFSQAVTIIAVDPPPASTGWTSTSTPAAGLYSDPNPVFFGPFLQAGGAQAVMLTDNSVPGVTAAVNIPAPIPTITATGVAGSVIFIPGGPGVEDDAASFQATVNAPVGGPQFRVYADRPVTAVSSSTALSATANTVTVTLSRIPDHGLAYVYFEDASYPDSVDGLVINFGATVTETEFILGKKDFGAGLSNILTLAGSVLPPEWQNYPGVPAVGMNGGGGAPEKVLTSEVVDLTGVSGDVRFTANFNIVDIATGLEGGDTFKAELILNGDTLNPVNLIASYDANGNGVMNGGDTAAEDEFNKAKLQDGDYVSDFPISFIIPDSATSVQLVITGVNDSVTEAFVFENVLLALSIADADGDGISDAYEDANGLDRINPADRDTDLDGDGQSNYQEFLAGTAANNPNSTLRITAMTFAGNNATITWTSVPGKIYRIDAGSNVATLADIGTDFPAAAGPAVETTASFTIPGPVPPRYSLRIRVK